MLLQFQKAVFLRPLLFFVRLLIKNVARCTGILKTDFYKKFERFFDFTWLIVENSSSKPGKGCKIQKKYINSYSRFPEIEFLKENKGFLITFVLSWFWKMKK